MASDEAKDEMPDWWYAEKMAHPTEHVHDRRTKQVIVMRKDLGMRKGKMVAQGAHASIAFLTGRIKGGLKLDSTLTEAERDWIDTSFLKVCVGVNSEEELIDIHRAAFEAGMVSCLITDAGFTEFNGVPTNTCVAIGPDWNERVDAITGHLKLL